MTFKQRLFTPLPPGVDPLSPQILAWRQDRLEMVVQELEERRAIDHPEPLPLKHLAGISLLLLIGLTGRIAPEAMLSIAVKLLTP